MIDAIAAVEDDTDIRFGKAPRGQIVRQLQRTLLEK